MTMSPGEPTQRFPRAILPDRYRDPVPIGLGGMGEVYRARDAELGRVVAVKVLAEHLAGQQEFRRRFRREAVSAARIAHPHVATVYDVGEHAGRPYLVMEYLSGGALSDRIAGRPSREEAIAWIEQTAGALDAAHARGVIHRDIKPANLLLDASGNVKVADFGIARVLEGGGSTVTAAGTVLGTDRVPRARAGPRRAGHRGHGRLLAGRGGLRAADRGAALRRAVDGGRDGRPPVRAGAAGVGERAEPAAGGRPGAGARDGEGARGRATRARATSRPSCAPPRCSPRRPPPPRFRLRRPRRPPREAAPPPPPPPERIVSRAGPRRALAPVLVPLAVLLAAAGVGIAMLGGGDDDPNRPAADGGTTTTVERRATTAEVADRPEPPDPLAQARRDVDRSTALLSDGEAAAALPLATAAFETLRGSGDVYEGNAGYNAGRSLIDLGRCDEAVPYLEAAAGTGSESQNEIRQAALEEARACAGDEGGDEATTMAVRSGRRRAWTRRSP